MSRIFISYKRADKEKVFKIKDQIESALGEKCWIDLDGIESDAVFASKIIGAINDCELFLFMYSKEHRIISDYENDWTIRELNFAQMQKKRVVFVNLDGSELTDWFNLLFGTKQQVDGRQKTSIDKLIRDMKTWLQNNSNEDVLSSKTKSPYNRRILFIGVFFTLLLLIILPLLSRLGSYTKENRSTIDTITQRICKKILLSGMKDSGADYGQVLVMECKTGDIKAMVEIKGEEDSTFEEPRLIYTETTDFDFYSESRMMSYISILACLETGRVDTCSIVDTGCGVAEIRGYRIIDHNWHRGGNGPISISKAIEVSSDVAVCSLVDSIFNGESLAFYKILEKMNYGKPDTLSFIKAVSPCVFTFPDTPHSWLGYNCKIFPIQILTFYNAIANDGVMVKPTVEKIEHPDIIAESIVTDKNLKSFQAILRKNVTDGYGKKTNSEEFKVAGIGAVTQTIYENGNFNYCLQYYAYFPIEAPKYSVLVTLHKKGLPASSGGMCGPIIKDIAEIIYYNKE